MFTKIKNWLFPTVKPTRIVDMNAEDFDGIANEMYKVIDFDLYDNHPQALEALEIIAEAYEDAAEILRRA